MFLVIFLYIAFLAFIGFSLKKAYDFAKMPMHGRWELYPVPKEKGRGEYGGSYLEETKWYEKPRETSLVAEIIDMAKEIIFIKKLFDNQRPFWWLSYSMHLGIYAMIAWLVLLFLAVFIDSSLLNGLIALAGGAGIIMVMIGSIGLLIKRMVNPEFKMYTTGLEYFNLFFLFAVAFTGFLCFITDPMFQYGHDMMGSMLTFFPFAPSALVTLHLVLAGAVIIYIPLTKMSHYVGKFFSFHKVLWDNDPYLPGNEIAEKVAAGKSYKQKGQWSAPHYPGNQKIEN
ncbi:respiratory nitrate reductase subunit gamma [Dehalobacterium formicoaceticum]|uniref:respiratory nitrate reductase subunit gamma n=1 Tax=Dehalobacterium formicoaceticum TaxID=51515 RepID=UPI000B7E55D6|nr:respiratory nitrate reductase subunit gamma [Dehalobacterium formicoaceticum]